MILSGERGEGFFFDPLHPWAALKRTIVNSVESGPGNPIIYYWIFFFFFGGGGFFYFLSLGKSGKSSTGNPTIYYWLWTYQGSKYASSSKHASALNISFSKYKKVLFPEIRRIYFWRFSFLKYKKSFLLRKYKRFFNIRARKIHFSGI